MTAKKDNMDVVLANIEKQMGHKSSKSPFARFGNIEKVDVPVIPFGVSDIDDATYCGGIPRGKMVEIFGGESSGKSLLSLFLIREAQKQGLNCALVDVEQSFDPSWAAMHGVDVEGLVYANTFDGAGEEALEYTYRLCGSGAFGLVVVDSTAALTPIAEIEGSLQENERVGAQARMMSRGCRKICDAIGKSGTTCVFINQVRMKIGGSAWGNPETTPGGKALPFYSHVRARVAKIGKIIVKEGGEDVVVGQKSIVKFIKNKVARPWGQAEFKIIFDESALNPVVMLANTLKSAKIISVYKGIFNISKQTAIDLYDEKKGIPTGCTTMVELADWLISSGNCIKLLD
jgi:recombination protein RecA